MPPSGFCLAAALAGHFKAVALHLNMTTAKPKLHPFVSLVLLSVGLSVLITTCNYVFQPATAPQATDPGPLVRTSGGVNTVRYLALRAGNPAPDNAVVVADSLADIQTIYAAAQAKDQQRFNALASKEFLIPGGSTVEVLSTNGDFVQVALNSFDTAGVDRSNDTGWVYKGFVQERQF